MMKKTLLGDKYVMVMEVIKVRGARKTTGNLVSFKVHPGYGMKIIPVSMAKPAIVTMGIRTMPTLSKGSGPFTIGTALIRKNLLRRDGMSPRMMIGIHCRIT